TLGVPALPDTYRAVPLPGGGFLRRMPWPTADSFDLLVPRDQLAAWWTKLRDAGAVARENRRRLTEVLGRQGFVNLPEEWWHFTYRPEAFPDRYFDFPVSVGAVRP
ncbi:M15 family metallopeptidase, partial [Streptomyces goshikiensis]